MKAIKRYIYLLRHGKTEYSKEKRYLGHTDCKLSEEGENEIGQVADIFIKNNIIIESIFSSDLKRCKTTMNIIFSKREIIFLKELREINMGDWDGLTFDEIKNKYPEDYKRRGEDIADFTPPSGESFRECQKRAVKVFDYIINNTKNNVAICSHAGFNRALLCYLLKLELKEMFSIKQDYGGVNIITSDNSNIKVEFINVKKDDFNL